MSSSSSSTFTSCPRLCLSSKTTTTAAVSYLNYYCTTKSVRLVQSIRLVAITTKSTTNDAGAVIIIIILECY